MPVSCNGRIARVNLSDRSVRVEHPDEKFYRRYLGGNGFVSYFLLNELPVGCDPLGEEALLVFAVSVMTGVPLPGFGRHSIGAKSPLNGFYGVSEAGGFWGAEFKQSGFDALLITGRADRPVYLWICDGKIEIRDASGIWGKDTGDTSRALVEELGDEKIRVAAIGPAGEALVKYAGVSSDLRHYSGRMGMGAVMGSKQLKAVAVRGRKRVEVADRETIKRLGRYFAEHYTQNADNRTLSQYGTSSYYYGANEAGGLPTRNYTQGQADFPWSIEELHERLKVGSEGCFACPVACKQVFSSGAPYHVDPTYGGPEFETWGALGSNCGVLDFTATAKGHELCNRLGLDTISTGLSISFAMECFEKGFLTLEDTGGIDLRFGNAEAMLEVITLIAERRGIGDFLAEGSWKAAKRLGKETEAFSISAKGLELALCDPRVKKGVALIYSISPMGGDHLQAEHDGAFDPQLSGYSHAADDPGYFMSGAHQLGVLDPVPSLSLGPEKVHLVTNLQHWFSLFDALDLCIFVFGPVRTFRPYQLAEMVAAATGWETSLYELMKAGERFTNMMRVFNLIHAGLTREDDRIPPRLYNGLENGPMKGSRITPEEQERALSYYYEMMSWKGRDGVPSEGKLYDLELGWAAKLLREAEIKAEM